MLSVSRCYKVLHKINIYRCSTRAVYLVNHMTSLSIYIIYIVADDTHFTIKLQKSLHVFMFFL
jgi:hypothetical protein